METSSETEFDPLELYDELAMAGVAPTPERFSSRYPEHPDLLSRIRALESLRADLDRAAVEITAGEPRWPDSVGGYRLLEPMGRGGMGVVFLGEDPVSGVRCAVKLLTVPSVLALQRFTREAEIMRQLHHPGIGMVLGHGVEGAYAFLTTALVDGVSLRSMIDAEDDPRGPPGTPEEIRARVEIMRRVSEAAGFAHRYSVIHRDIKPSNIMCDRDGRPKLIDFGIALDLRGERLTATGVFLGSAAYAAPEQLVGDKRRIGPWTDTYALGATLFELLTHRIPTVASKRRRSFGGDPRGPRYWNTAVPRGLDAVVRRALSLEIGKRYSDGEALAKALADWLD